MSRTFLTEDSLAKASASLQKPPFALSGALHGKNEWPSTALAESLKSDLEEKWKLDPDFIAAGPIWIGSAARGELCPRSDLDLIFCGDEAAVGRFVRRQQEAGLRVRSRVPEDPADWSVGVDIPDLMALLEAIPVTDEVAAPLKAQKIKLEARRHRERKKWRDHLWREQKEREKRHDSIANFLEPNLKYGPGGLRDLDQARQILRLFPERFPNSKHASQLLESYAGYWTLLRQKLHLEGQGDILAGPAQFDLARWFDLPHKDFMREVQKGLSRVHFYSQWIFATARASESDLRKIDNVKIKNPAGAIHALENDSSILMQAKVRSQLDDLFPKSWSGKNLRLRGQLLEKMLRPGASEDFVVALFRARVIERLCPEFKPLIGWVQHDQYHRYTADVHLQQACREWQRALKTPRRLGVLASEVKALSKTDSRILGLSLFCHDLMKGRQGDHSELGRRWVQKELTKMKIPGGIVSEVEWLVENHLELSEAAFRRNPRSSTTWTRLQNRGAEGLRLRRLAVFTAVDIQATNPEAWNPWKARLIADLLKTMRSPVAQNSLKFQKELAAVGLSVNPETFDRFLLSRIAPKTLAKDLSACANSQEESSHLVLPVNQQGQWIRFFEKHDRPGVFADFVQKLFTLGLGVRHASVQTLDGVGVYDWFEVQTRRTPLQIRAWLNAPSSKTKPAPKVQFQSISMVSQDETEWVLSFKGLDQPGLLVAAARAQADENISVRAAAVHTWGRQVDDIFHVTPRGSIESLLKNLHQHFQVENSRPL